MMQDGESDSRRMYR